MATPPTLEAPSALPSHVAIIMDGNGRWAKARGLPRTAGHKQGIEAVKRIVRVAGAWKLPYLTLFGFSSENWARPATEIADLMGFLRHYLRSESAEMHKNNVKLRVIGRRDRLDADIVTMIAQTEALTTHNTGLCLTIALDYGGQQDILQAAAKALADCVTPENLTEEKFASYLQTAGLPDPDVMIRTSGEQRLSNFLLWPCAYSEFVFTETLWPDFDEQAFAAALTEFTQRQRRFGGVPEPENTTQLRMN